MQLFTLRTWKPPETSSHAKYTLHAGKTYVLGRSSESDIQIPHMSVSRFHAKLHIGSTVDEIWLEDLNTVNGSFIDNQRVIGKALIPFRARIRFGECPNFMRISPKNEVNDPFATPKTGTSLNNSIFRTPTATPRASILQSAHKTIARPVKTLALCEVITEVRTSGLSERLMNSPNSPQPRPMLQPESWKTPSRKEKTQQRFASPQNKENQQDPHTPKRQQPNPHDSPKQIAQDAKHQTPTRTGLRNRSRSHSKKRGV